MFLKDQNNFNVASATNATNATNATKANSANSATKATQDSAGQQINTTYIKGLSVNGRTITYTKGDGTTGTITTQDTDTNTTYSAGTGLSLSGTTFNHKNSVTAGTAQGDANKTLSWGGKFTIPTVTYDAQGHITAKGTTTMTMPSNPNTDTHWTSGTIVGASATATSNAASSNGSTYINHIENGAVRNAHKIVGSGATTVTSDSSGNITISSTDTNTNTWRGVQNNLTSSATDQSLSANQGRILKGLVDGKANTSHTHDSYVQGSNSTRTTDQNGNGNDIKASGFYRVSSTSSSTNIFPDGQHSHILHGQHPSTSGYAYQLAVPYSATNKIYFRNNPNSSWGAWNKIYHSGDKPTPSEIGAAASSHTHNYAGSSSAGGNANAAVKLATARTINGTNFDGTANITTANWGTARTITLGATGKSVNGSANVSWSFAEIAKGQGLTHTSAMGTLYYNNAGVNHVGRLSCYNSSDYGDYTQLSLYNTAAQSTVNWLNIIDTHIYTKFGIHTYSGGITLNTAKVDTYYCLDVHRKCASGTATYSTARFGCVNSYGGCAAIETRHDGNTVGYVRALPDGGIQIGSGKKLHIQASAPTANLATGDVWIDI